MSNILTEEAIVLRMTSYGESDFIVRLLCEQTGKHSVIAKGARKSRRRFGGVLDVGAHLRVQWQERRQSDLGLLLEAEAVSILPAWSQSFETFSVVMFALEMVDKMVSEKQPVEGKFQCLKIFLQELRPEKWWQQLLEWEWCWLKSCGWAVEWTPPAVALKGFGAQQRRLDLHLQEILGKPLRSGETLYKIAPGE